MVDVRINARSAPVEDPRQRQQGGRYYLWNSRRVDTVDDDLFDPSAWRQAGQLAGQARGRGAAYFLRPDETTGWVLRHSRRGGLVAGISDDRYVWLGRARCRVFREFRLLAELRARSLPVPAPVAARVVRRGCSYTGDLITVEVPNARPLADWLEAESVQATVWREVGATVARFHAAGVYHHDLNARNILVGADDAITLIDFDKSAIRRPGRWQRRNLARLRRSLDKISNQVAGRGFNEQHWGALRSGYDAALA